MKTRHRYFVLLFWGVLVLDCLLIYSHREEYRLATKSLLMPILLLYYLANTSHHKQKRSKSLAASAFLLAWAGDILLLFQGETFFISGLILFLLMHVIYIIYFWRVYPLFPVRYGLYFFLPIVLVVAFDILIMKKIIPLAGELGNPLIAYMVVISFMFVMACNMLSNKRVQSMAINFFIPGAAMFLISDAILGLNMFLWEDHLIGIAVMLSYGYAQYLIVHGFIKHIRGRMTEKEGITR
jgi:uncharacterized membrane protein YhhN